MSIEQQMNERSHARFSASAAARWMRCPGSIALSDGMGSKSSAQADEGTRAHAYAARLLLEALGEPCESAEPDGPDMERHCRAYADFCLEREGVRKVEARVGYESIAPGGFGTADYLCWSGDGVLHVIDFKYGEGIKVSAEANPQLMLYALGALETYGEPCGAVKSVEMSIFQPRMENVSTATVTRRVLAEVGKSFKAAAQAALEPKPKCASGEWCRFCPAIGKCREHARQFASIVSSFEKDALPPDLSDEEIAQVLRMKPRLLKWLQAVEDFATECAVKGHEFDGMELKTRTVRAYVDEQAVALALKAAGIDPYTRKIKALTTVEKEVGKKKAEEILSGLIRTTEGRQSLVALK